MTIPERFEKVARLFSEEGRRGSVSHPEIVNEPFI